MNDVPAGACRSVQMTVAANGSMTVLVNAEVLAPTRGTWTRESFAAVLDLVTDYRRHDVVLKVQEADGSTFSAVVRSISRRSSPPCSPEDAMGAAGFIPGEEVAVALVVHHRTSSEDGRLHMRGPTSAHGGGGELVLIGRLSGTLHFVDPE